jgi:outer membrane protein insertion porin family
MKIIPIFVSLCLILLTLASWAQDTAKIAKIQVTGNEGVDKGLIMNNIKTKVNDPYDFEQLKEDMKSIYGTGFFSDVQIDVKDTDQGKVVTFVVIERPPVKGIYISGNKIIKTSEIMEKVKIKTNSVLNIEKIKESLDEIRKLYAGKGYYGTKVSYDISYEEGNTASVRFTVAESEKAFVKKISFTGNKKFSSSKLRGLMKVSEKGMFSIFTGSGVLDEEALEDDRKRIEGFYYDNGYVRVKVGVPQIDVSKDRKTIKINISIDEGSLYKIGKIDFTGDVIFPKAELAKALKSKPGNTFRASLYQGDVLTLSDRYQDKGYAFCEVTPLSEIDDNARTLSIVYEISKGQEVYVNRINILGNVRTRDKVIRRELRVAEGDRFSSTNIARSKKRLTNTTYFKEIDFKTVKTDEPDRVNLDISVEEKPTGTLSFGVGYSSTENVMLSGSISQENMRGTGRKVFLTAALGSETHDFNLTYVEPYVLDMNFTAALSLINFTRYMDSYDYAQTGGSVAVSRPLTDDVTGSIKYRYETTDVTNISLDASTYIWRQRGTSTTSSIFLALGKNTIDNVMNPTKGINSDISYQFAGSVLGGTNDFNKVTASYGRYIPAGFWDSCFFIRGTAGLVRAYGGKEIPIYETYYVGGLNSVRGFKYGEAGPLDVFGDPIGGENELYFNTEWIVPILKGAGLKGLVFFDAGHGFDESKGWLMSGARTSAGFGIRWFSPMGPIRMELGFNLSPKEGERGSVFDFTIGSQY